MEKTNTFINGKNYMQLLRSVQEINCIDINNYKNR